jgi:purine-nucleoside phosphorylase
MHDLITTIDESVKFLLSKQVNPPKVGIVLGTGLNAMVENVTGKKSISYAEIPGFAPATVEFHKGQLIFGRLEGKDVVIMQGRYHFYEGYSMQQITFPVRVMKKLGIEYLLLSNAAGGIRGDLKKGDLVLIDDHINLLPENPLRGLNDPVFGNRFVDMCQPYNQSLGEKLTDAAKELAINLKKGIYASVPGPNLETRSEYRYLRSIGADLVGMSTVPEIIVSNHVGLPCAAISVVTDECDPDNLQPVNIEEIIRVAGASDTTLSKLFIKMIGSL